MASPEKLLDLMTGACDLERALMGGKRASSHLLGVALQPGERSTLYKIARNEGISQRALSQEMFRAKSATSVVVDQLEEKGLVVRTPVRTGPVRYLLTLTPKGREVYGEMVELALRSASRITEQLPLDAEQLEQAVEVMGVVYRYYLRRGESEAT